MGRNVIRPDFTNYIRKKAALYQALKRLDLLITHCQRLIDYADANDLENDLKSSAAKMELQQGYNHAMLALKSLVKAIDEEIKLYESDDKKTD